MILAPGTRLFFQVITGPGFRTGYEFLAGTPWEFAAGVSHAFAIHAALPPRTGTGRPTLPVRMRQFNATARWLVASKDSSNVEASRENATSLFESFRRIQEAYGSTTGSVIYDHDALAEFADRCFPAMDEYVRLLTAIEQGAPAALWYSVRMTGALPSLRFAVGPEVLECEPS